jgi:hypothetical protein
MSTRDQRLDVGLDQHVAGAGAGLGAELTYFAGHLGELVGEPDAVLWGHLALQAADVVDDELRALAREAAHDRGAEALDATGSGDDGDLVLQIRVQAGSLLLR